MNKKWISFLMLCVGLVSFVSAQKKLSPWETGAFESGKYRNLLAEMGYKQKDIDAKVKESFDGLFEGPDKVYFEVGDSMAYISDIKNHDVRTEGLSYGLMIAVQFDRKDMFDRLWRWGKKYMQHQEGPHEGYFAWSCKLDGTRNSDGPASDGELYYVTALIFASNRWGNTSGIHYLKEAQRILNCMMAKDGTGGVTNIINMEHKLITFVPDVRGGRFTDPSYHLPAFYEVWARWADDGRADLWRECAKKSREYLHKSIHPVTGLNPDYNNYDGTLLNSRRIVGDAFRFDSWRVPMNMALDYSWACADKDWQREYGHKIQNFLYGQGIDTFVDQYNVDGTTVTDTLDAGGYKALRHSLGLVASSAAASLLCSHDKSREFVDRLWKARHVPYADGYFDAYYDGLLRLFALMHLSGRYQIIFPQENFLWMPATLVEKTASVTSNSSSATIDIAMKELRTCWKGSPVHLQIQRSKEFKQMGEEAFMIRKHGLNDITIESCNEKGLLYGAYHLLRLQASGNAGGELQVVEQPSYAIRILNHWDNLDRTVERGYAGRSLWLWDELPGTISPRYEQYARANASIGINATVLNNVNASPQILSVGYLKKVQALADIFRPYQLKVYLAINFSSPAELGGLATSDPLDKEVQQWWKAKVKEIYGLIPDFGGFLVKANSEGLPGPQDFGRTHADGANMLADALKPYKGLVMWRAFVYSPGDEDRAKQAYQEFLPLDGQFRDNVIIQVKNGPVDFQPREPFSPLLGAMKQTPVMAELQITQEYLGFSNHLCYLAPMWKECLDSDTYQVGEGSTIAKLTTHQSITAISGVANIGDDANWCGHPFAQSNWYAFGRLAWNPQLTSDAIADEWLKQTFTPEPGFVNPVKEMMLESHEAVVDYMMPLGLHHLFAFGHHYGPEPWCHVPGAREDWLPAYYHKADATGLGFDRSSTGSNATAQYHSPLCDRYDHIETCPENLILWFHHVPWKHRMKSGRSMWDELCVAYDRGVQQARKFQKVWDAAEKYVDSQRFTLVQHKLRIQARDAVWWKDGCLLYFQQFSKLPIPSNIERPVHNLEDMMQYHIKITNHECPPYGYSK